MSHSIVQAATLARLNFVDVARAYAIALALLSHAMFDTGGWGWAAVHGLAPLRLLVSTATPLFVFMFGMMLELVYARRAARDGIAAVRPKLFYRSWQCYLGYMVTAVAGIIGGYHTLGHGVKTLVLAGGTHYSGILRLYAVALLLAPAILALRFRFGVRGLVVTLALIWGLDAIVVDVDRLAETSLGPVNSWLGMLFGIGANAVGPSVFHGMTFILVGMLIAGSLSDWKERGLSLFYKYIAVAVVISAVTVTPVLLEMGVRDAVNEYIQHGGFRTQNHVAYYGFGLILCLFTLLVLSFVIPSGKMPAWSRVPLQFGQASLSSFAGGNALLALCPPGSLKAALGPQSPMSFVASIAFVVFVLALANFRRIWGAVAPGRLFGAPTADAP